MTTKTLGIDCSKRSVFTVEQKGQIDDFCSDYDVSPAVALGFLFSADWDYDLASDCFFEKLNVKR